ncbi:response regulator FixJ [Methylobacterium sp. CM6257]
MPDARLVHVIDDDDAVRDSLRMLLDTCGFTVRTYETATTFLEQQPLAHKGCVVADIRMPGMSGLELAVRLKELGSPLPIIVITGHGDVPLAVEAMRAGVSDFLEKPFEDEDLLRAVETALAPREEQADRAVLRAAVTERRRSLSEREQQVLDGLVAGKANKVIAEELGISHRTVEIYRAHVMSKMQAGSLSELVRMIMMSQQEC